MAILMPTISLSVISMPPLRLLETLKVLLKSKSSSMLFDNDGTGRSSGALESESDSRIYSDEVAGKLTIDRLHVDVMDGHFVPRLGLYPEFVNSLREVTQIPIDIHLMTANPFDFLKAFRESGASQIICHAESTPHLHRLVASIKSNNMQAGVAFNPATPFAVLDHLSMDLDNVTVMAINPGIVGHELIPSTYSRIKELREFLKSRDFQGRIEVDGGVLFSNARALVQSGANSLVCGAGTVLHPAKKPLENLKTLQEVLTQEQE